MVWPFFIVAALVLAPECLTLLEESDFSLNVLQEVFFQGNSSIRKVKMINHSVGMSISFIGNSMAPHRNHSHTLHLKT